MKLAVSNDVSFMHGSDNLGHSAKPGSDPEICFQLQASQPWVAVSLNAHTVTQQARVFASSVKSLFIYTFYEMPLSANLTLTAIEIGHLDQKLFHDPVEVSIAS